MSTAEPVSDRGAIGKAIYLAMYQHKGGLWEANETKEVWYEIADRFSALSHVQAPAPVAAPVQVKALGFIGKASLDLILSGDSGGAVLHAIAPDNSLEYVPVFIGGNQR